MPPPRRLCTCTRAATRTSPTSAWPWRRASTGRWARSSWPTSRAWTSPTTPAARSTRPAATSTTDRSSSCARWSSLGAWDARPAKASTTTAATNRSRRRIPASCNRDRRGTETLHMQGSNHRTRWHDQTDVMAAEPAGPPADGPFVMGGEPFSVPARPAGIATVARSRLGRALNSPTGLLSGIRWALLLFSLCRAGIVLGVLALGDHCDALRLLAVVALAGISLKWIATFRLDSQMAACDLLDVTALVLATVATGSPMTVLMILYVRVCYRAMESSPSRTVAIVAVYSLGLAAAVSVVTPLGSSIPF